MHHNASFYITTHHIALQHFILHFTSYYCTTQLSQHTIITLTSIITCTVYIRINCDRPHKKVTQISTFSQILHLALHIFAENLVQLACCIAKIRLLLCLDDRKFISSKRKICTCHADNFPCIFVYLSVNMYDVSNTPGL